MKIEEYYNDNYPDGKPWDQLSREEKRTVRRERSRENWAKIKETVGNIRETVEDIGDFIDLLLVVFGKRK